MNSSKLPLIAITMGDPAGSGAELLNLALNRPEFRGKCHLLVVGDAALMKRARAITESGLEIVPVGSPGEARQVAEGIAVLDLRNVDMGKHRFGVVAPEFGQAAYDYIKTAAELCRSGEVDAMVTSAINKESLNAAGHHYDGHTGLLSALFDDAEVSMMLVADGLRVLHVSTHVSLREAIERVRPERILNVIRLAEEGIRKLGISKPRLAVAGLNPHAGEGGLFGDEEQRYIRPALEQARAEGYNVSGPFAGDTIFFRAWQGDFDGVIAMYHDQGHVAAKMLGIWKGVNVTLGLPIIRTSVEHGTDFPNAGTGKSDPRSLIEAIGLAVRMARGR